MAWRAQCRYDWQVGQRYVARSYGGIRTNSTGVSQAQHGLPLRWYTQRLRPWACIARRRGPGAPPALRPRPHHRVDGVPQRVQFGVGQGMSGAARIDVGQEQAFRGEDVADPGHRLLVHQHRLDRVVASAVDAAGRLGAVESAAWRVVGARRHHVGAERVQALVAGEFVGSSAVPRSGRASNTASWPAVSSLSRTCRASFLNSSGRSPTCHASRTVRRGSAASRRQRAEATGVCRA